MQMIYTNPFVDRLNQLGERGDEDAKSFLRKYNAAADYLPKYFEYINSACPYFTNHGERHIASVIRAASLMLAGHLDDSSKAKLSAFEIFMLLMAILSHDAGMVLERKGHNEVVSKILDEIRLTAIGDVTCQRYLQEMIKAHTGKNTLRSLKLLLDYHHHVLYQSAFAAILRFADEISEDSTRISLPVLASGKVPEDQQIYWYYAKAVSASKPDPQRERVAMTISLDKTEAIRTFPHPDRKGEQVSLIKYILERIEKVYNEKAYCAPYFSRFLTIKSIYVHFTLCNGSSAIDGYDEEIDFPEIDMPHAAIADSFFAEHHKWDPSEIEKLT